MITRAASALVHFEMGSRAGVSWGTRPPPRAPADAGARPHFEMDQRRGGPGDHRDLPHRPGGRPPTGSRVAAPRPAGAAEILVAEDCRGVGIRFTVYGLRKIFACRAS